MSTFRRIGFGCLVGICFAVGYSARLHSMAREEAVLQSVRRERVGAPGVQVAAARLESAGNIDLRPLEIMVTVLNSLREHYVDQIGASDEGKMTYDSLRAMLSSLDDPNTRFLDPAQRKLVTEAAGGSYHGIGVILGIRKIKTGEITEEHLVVITPVESGPAAKAGLRPGDDIVAIDGRDVLPFDPYERATENIKEERKKSVGKGELRKHIDAETERIEKGIPVLEAENLLVSEDAKAVELSVVRKGSPKRTKNKITFDFRQIKLKITPQAFTVNPVTCNFLENENLGCIKINCFSTSTGEQFEAAVRDLKSKGAKGLALDLRNLAGGGLDTVLDVARPLLSGKPLAVEHKSRDRKSVIKVAECPAQDAWRGPIVVLVNPGTARMSEVLAAALRDDASAKLVGEKTYGDCSVVTLVEQRDGSAISMTTGKLVPTKSTDYQGKGLAPDVQVASAGPDDAQLKEAIKVLGAMAALRQAQGSGSAAATASAGGRS